MSEPKSKLSDFLISEIKDVVSQAIDDCVEDADVTFWLGTVEVFVGGDAFKRVEIEELAEEAEKLFNNSKDPEEIECWLETAGRLEKIASRMRSIVETKPRRKNAK